MYIFEEENLIIKRLKGFVNRPVEVMYQPQKCAYLISIGDYRTTLPRVGLNIEDVFEGHITEIVEEYRMYEEANR